MAVVQAKQMKEKVDLLVEELLKSVKEGPTSVPSAYEKQVDNMIDQLGFEQVCASFHFKQPVLQATFYTFLRRYRDLSDIQLMAIFNYLRMLEETGSC